MKTLAGIINQRFIGDTNERLERLSAALKGIGLNKTVKSLNSTQALLSVTTDLDAVESNNAQWRSAVIELIQVAEILGDKKVSAHVLAWTRTTQGLNTAAAA